MSAIERERTVYIYPEQMESLGAGLALLDQRVEGSLPIQRGLKEDGSHWCACPCGIFVGTGHTAHGAMYSLLMHVKHDHGGRSDA